MCKWFLTAAAAALVFVADPSPAGAQVIVTTRYAIPFPGGYVPNYGGYAPAYGGYASTFGGYSPAYGGAMPYGYGGLTQAGLNAALGVGGYGSYQGYSHFAQTYGGTGYETYRSYSGYTPYYGGSGYGFANPGYYSGGRGYYYGTGGWRR